MAPGLCPDWTGPLRVCTDENGGRASLTSGAEGSEVRETAFTVLENDLEVGGVEDMTTVVFVLVALAVILAIRGVVREGSGGFQRIVGMGRRSARVARGPDRSPEAKSAGDLDVDEPPRSLNQRRAVRCSNRAALRSHRGRAQPRRRQRATRRAERPTLVAPHSLA